MYRIIKTKFENYLDILSPKFRIELTKFRTSNHNLPIETGRWHNIQRHERYCTFCKTELGDEFHFLFVCEHFKTLRKQLIHASFYNKPNILKLAKLLNSTNQTVLINLCKFIKNGFKEVTV